MSKFFFKKNHRNGIIKEIKPAFLTKKTTTIKSNNQHTIVKREYTTSFKINAL